MSPRSFAGLAGIALVVSLLLAAPASADKRQSAGASVVQVPVSFTVHNINRSKLACASDGRTYTVRGHLVAPANRPLSGRAATLYLHGLSFGEFFWRYQGASGYNYAAAQARAGNVSVVIDRVGYVSSDKGVGNQICVGSRADMAHQMITDLRAGTFDFDGRRAPKFSKIALAGHSYGAQIAQVEAYSFRDIDGLIVLAYADRVQSALLKSNAAYAARVCATGGLRVNGSGPKGYAPFGPPSGADASLFSSTPARIELAVEQLLSIDPCGDTASFAPAVGVDLANLKYVRVPVLVVSGGKDALFPPPAGPNQATLFTGSRSVSQVTLPKAAHALTFEDGRRPLVAAIDRWLRLHVTSAYSG